MNIVKVILATAVIGGASLLGGCATKEQAERAQTSADLADSDAKAAMGAAGRAQSTADGAAKTAQDALASAQSANDKVDKLIADIEKRREEDAHHHHRRHHHHVASNADVCPPAQQKSELRRFNKQASIMTPTKAPDRTTQN